MSQLIGIYGASGFGKEVMPLVRQHYSQLNQDNIVFNDDGGRGSAYIFTRSGSTWTQQAKIVASDGANNDYFGYSVSISSDGKTAIVGAYGDDDRGTDAGSAYIFG